MEFLGTVFSDHPFFAALITSPDGQKPYRGNGFPTTNRSAPRVRAIPAGGKNPWQPGPPMTKRNWRHKKQPIQEPRVTDVTDEIPQVVPEPQKAVQAPQVIKQEPSIEGPPQVNVVPQEPTPEPEVDSEETNMVRNFFDIVYRGKVTLLQGFLKRQTNPFDLNTLLPQNGSKRYREMCRTDGWGALHFCAWLNHTEMAQFLISKGANVDLQNMWEQAPLHVATCRGKTDMVELLLKAGADVNSLIPRRQNQIAFHIACICGHFEVAKVLETFGANILRDNQNGSGPTSSLQLALQKGNPKIVALILASNPRFTHENGRDPLSWVGPQSDPELFLTMITHLDKNLGQGSSSGLSISVRQLAHSLNMIGSSSFLMEAAKRTSLSSVIGEGTKELLEYLISQKIGLSGLHYAFYTACMKDKLEEAQLLMKSGNYSTKSFVDFTSGPTSCLHLAAMNGFVDIINFLLDAGANPEVRNESSSTPLLVAASRGKVEAVRALAPRVNVNAVDDQGQSALHIAASRNDVGVIEILCDYKAEINMPNTKRQGMSPLHVAASGGKNEAIKLLLSRGADVNQSKTRQKGPQTALDMARESSYKATEKILLDAGAVDSRKARKKDASSVSLCSFEDVCPSQFIYPKSCVLPTINFEDEDKGKDFNHSSFKGAANTATRQWQTIRLFISSTFTDMQAERDYLIKVTMPILKQMAAQRRLHLVEVDLRWGVTEEEARTGKTLEICLSEVDNCLIFAGLLGEKYGWVPTENQVRDDLKVRYDWIEGTSVTEMEIKRAFSNQHQAKCFTSFYFRDPESITKVPAQYKKDFVDAKTTEMENLKKFIQKTTKNITTYKTQFSKVGGDGSLEFSGLKDFGDKFLANVWNSIEAAFPADQEEPSELDQETFYHDQFIAHRTKNFCGRKDKIKELEKYIKTQNTEPYVVSGMAGSGKSALMAYFSTYLKENTSHFVLSHFVGASPKSTDIIHVIKRLYQELVKEYGLWEQLSDDLDDYHTLVEKFEGILKLVSKEVGSKRCVIIVDAVNQMDDDRNKPSQMKWLPKVLPPGIRMIVSCLGGECLETLRSRNHPILEIGELNIKDRQDIVTTLLSLHNKRLDSNQMKMLFSKKDVTEPLYLVVVCQELRLHGVYEKLDAKINEIAPSLVGLLDQVLNRLEAEQGRNLIRDALSLLQCSRHGLIELEIVEMLGANSSVWASLSLSLGLFLRPMGREGQLDFFHRQIAKAVQRKYLSNPESITKYHKKIAEYYLQKCDPKQDGSFVAFGSEKVNFVDPCPTALNELCYHLLHAEMYSTLVKTMCNFSFVKRRAKNGQIFHLVSDFSMVEDFKQAQLKGTETTMINEFKRFIQTHAPQLAEQPEGTFQLALNQTYSNVVASEAKTYLRSCKDKLSYIEWVNRPVAGDKGFLFLYMASLDVNDVAFSPDAKLIVSVQKDGTCSLWSTITGMSTHLLPLSPPASCWQ